MSSLLAQRREAHGSGPRSLRSGAGVSEEAPQGCYWESEKPQTQTSCSHWNHCPCPGEMHYCVALTGKGCKQEEAPPIPTPLLQPSSLPPAPLLTE